MLVAQAVLEGKRFGTVPRDELAIFPEARDAMDLERRGGRCGAARPAADGTGGALAPRPKRGEGGRRHGGQAGEAGIGGDILSRL